MKILMVCLGNICRSPLAEGILKDKINSRGLKAEVDSAGTAAYHAGEKPDPRSQAIAFKHGIDISKQRARKFEVDDFEQFDKIFAMDTHNFHDIVALANNRHEVEKVEMILNKVHPGKDRSVPDPYYGGRDGFQQVYNMLNAACEVIAEEIATAQKTGNN